jgi:hypothetical protein
VRYVLALDGPDAAEISRVLGPLLLGRRRQDPELAALFSLLLTQYARIVQVLAAPWRVVWAWRAEGVLRLAAQAHEADCYFAADESSTLLLTAASLDRFLDELVNDHYIQHGARRSSSTAARLSRGPQTRTSWRAPSPFTRITSVPSNCCRS